MFCGGVKLDEIIGCFFYVIGINVKFGYGMIEIMVMVFCWDDYCFNLDLIGFFMLGV